MRKFAALALVLALTGCAAQEPAPKVTPVDRKFCALSDSAGFNDDGLNRSVYAALQQLKVQTGASVMAIESGSDLPPASGIQKLIDAKCNAIITSGEDLAKPALAAAKANDRIRFVSVSDILNTGGSSPNFVALTFDIYQAAFTAGYLSAEVVSASVAENQQIVIFDKLKNSESARSAKAFVSGVARFNTQNKAKVAVKNSSLYQGEKLIFAIAGNAGVLDGLQVSSTTSPLIIGYGRDWYADSRNADYKTSILTSVIRFGVIDKVVAAVTSGAGTQNFDLESGQVGLVPQNEIPFPGAFTNALNGIIEDLATGKVKVG